MVDMLVDEYWSVLRMDSTKRHAAPTKRQSLHPSDRIVLVEFWHSDV